MEKYDHLPKCASDARACGATYYFTGKPCKHGHIEKRLTANGTCAACAKAVGLLSYARHSESRRSRVKSYYNNNREKIKAYTSSYAKNKKLEKKLRDAEENKSAIGDLYVSREFAIEHGLKYYNEGKLCKNGHRGDRTTKGDRCAACDLIRVRQRYKTDPEFVFACTCRNMVTRVLSSTGDGKNAKTKELLGYSTRDLMKHIESQFKDGMSWENYGDWHIDHIIPIAALVRIGVKDPAVINSLENLQPLWAKDNLSKGDRIDGNEDLIEKYIASKKN